MAAKAELRPAAQYLRMSTDHQRYSTANQMAAISAYAVTHGYTIVQTYADEGLSGLTIRTRRGLKSLLADVLDAERPYRTVLVYDVSRWGRFQNPDEGAHYEFLCAQAGVSVEYCAEAFVNDGSPLSALLKSVRRVMAAEFSRDLSVKVAAGRRRIASMGYWTGGTAGYGLRRQVLDPESGRASVLQLGERKAVIAHRSILVPGPAEEVAIVLRIFRMFAHAGLSLGEIARVLNAEGVLSERGTPWTHIVVGKMLRNPKYCGEVLVKFAKSAVGQRPDTSDPSLWVRAPDAFEAIVPRSLFEAAQRQFKPTRVMMSREDMLTAARRIHDANGIVTFRLIDETPGIPSRFVYKKRFGTISELRCAIGLPVGRVRRRRGIVMSDEQAIAHLSEIALRHGRISWDLIAARSDIPMPRWYAQRFGGLKQAYARAGYVQLSAEELRSSVGRARAATADAVMRKLAESLEAPSKIQAS